MIIDSHTHLGRNDHIKSTADELIRSMDKAGIDKSFVFAGEMNDCSNEWLFEQIAPHKDRLLAVAAYSWNEPHPPIPWGHSQQLADWYSEGKIVAVKFYTGYEHYYPHEAYNILSKLNRVGCPAIFHSGDCLNSVKCAKLKYAHPLLIDEVAVDFPNINFIIAHMAYPFQREAAEVCYKNANVYSDISGFVYGKFKNDDPKKFKKVIGEFLDICSSDKLLLGTDWPISDQSSYLKTLREDIGMGLTPEFLTDNVQKVFKLYLDGRF